MGLVKTRRLAAMQKQQRAKIARYVTCPNKRRGVRRSFWYNSPALPVMGEKIRFMMESFLEKIKRT